MSLEDLKSQIQYRKDIKEFKEKLGILSSLNTNIAKAVKHLLSIKEGQTNEVVVKNMPEPQKEVSVTNFPEQKESIKIDGDISLKKPKWFTLDGIEKSIKTLSDRLEKTFFKVDLDKYKKGTEAISVRLVDKEGKPYVAKGSGAYPSFGSVNVRNSSGVEVNPATAEGQNSIVQAIENITVPAPAGGATESKQDTMIGHLDGVEGLLTTMEANQLPDGHNVSVASLPTDSRLATAVDASSSGDNTIVSITGTPRLFYICLSADGANLSDVTATVKIGSSSKYKVSLKAGAIWARNIGAGRNYITGSSGDDIVVNLSAAQTVHVSVEYQDA